MKGIIAEEGYIYNFDKRCLYCNAYEVVQIDVGRSNLITNQFGVVMCKDPTECHNNLKHENSLIEVGVSDKNITLTDKYGNEVCLKEQPQFNDDFKGYFGSNGDDYDD